MKLYNKKFSNSTCKLLIRQRLHNKKILKLLEPQKTDKILDVGCNKGVLVKMLRKFSNYVKGCDVNEEAVIGSEVKGLNIMSAETLSYEDASFNKIVSSHTIEHVPNLKKALYEMNRILKNDGTCVLIYPFEIFRGCNNFFEAWRVYGNPFMSRKLHLHKLSPKKVSRIAPMKIVKKGLFFGPYPTYYTVLKK